MILNEISSNSSARFFKIHRALKENYGYELNFDQMTPARAQDLITRTSQAIAESKDVNNRVKLKLIAESLDLWMKANVQSELTDVVAEALDDDSVDEAKVIIAAQELSDKLQDMIEDVAQMQVQDLLPIVDAMKSEIGSAEADVFSSQADAALGTLLDNLKAAKEEYSNAIAAAQGEVPGTDMDNFDADDDMDFDADDMDIDDSDMDMDDEFGGDPGEIADDEPLGREMKDEG